MIEIISAIFILLLFIILILDKVANDRTGWRSYKDVRESITLSRKIRKFPRRPPSQNLWDNFPIVKRFNYALNRFKELKYQRGLLKNQRGGPLVAPIIAVWSYVIAAGVTVGMVVKGALIAGSIIMSFATAGKKTGKSASDSGYLINTQSTSEPLPIVYGTTRVGGNRVYINTTTMTNVLLHVILTVSEGPVKGIKQDSGGAKIWLNSERFQDIYPGISRTEEGDWGAVWRDEGEADPWIFWRFFKGTMDQEVCTDLKQYDPNWNDAMRGTAYLYLRLQYNPDIFGGFPEITLEVEGRELYDPRNPTAEPAYSANPALVALDFLRNDRYSLGINPDLPLTLIDADSVIAVANWAKDSVKSVNRAMSGNVVTLETATPHGLEADDQIRVSGLSGIGYNGVGIVVASVPDTTHFTYASNGIQTVTRARSNNIALLRTAVPHGLRVGDTIGVFGLGGTGYNGTGITVATTPDVTYFTYANAGDDEIETLDDDGIITSGLEAETLDANGVITNGYEFNGAIVQRKAFIDNMDDILRNFRTGIAWSEGTYKLFVYEYDVPVMTLTEDDIVADSFKTILPGIPETPNRVLITYPNIMDNYVSKTKTIEDPAVILVNDLEERDFELELIGTVDGLQGEKLGGYYLERNRLNRQHSFLCHPRVLALEQGIDMIQIIHSLPGWVSHVDPADNKVVRVLDMSLAQDGLILLTILEEYPELYDDIVNLNIPGYYGPTLPNPFAPPPDVTDLELEETYDTPGIYITFTVPGSNTNWNYAKVFVSTDGITYNPITTIFTDDPVVFHDVIPGTKYWIKIISYSIYDIPSANPPVETIELLSEGFRPPNIQGLEIEGQGNDTEWEGRDVKFAWRPIMLLSGAGVNPADEDILDAGQGFPDDVWMDYKVEIWVGGVKKREESRLTPDYIYFYEKNAEDNGAASNALTIKVWNRSIYNIMSLNAAVLEVTNPAPAAPTGLTATEGFQLITLSWTNPTDLDLASIEIYRNTVDDSGTSVKIAEILANQYTDTNLPNNTEQFYWLKAKDSFGNVSGFSSVSNATTTGIGYTDINDFAINASKIFTKIPILDGDAWEDNSPGTGYVAWNAHTIYFNGVAYPISAGNTDLKYIYWLNGGTTYTTSDTNPTLTDDDFIIAVNVGGYHDLAWNAIANQVIGSAYIEDLNVITIKIGDNAVTIPVSAYTEGVIDCPADTETTIQTCVFTSTGAPIFLTWSFAVWKEGGGAFYIAIRLYRDSTLIHSIESWKITDGALIGLNKTDVVSAGEYTYTVRVYPSGIAAKASIRSLMALETKK